MKFKIFKDTALMNLVLYVMLLIATPFLLVRNYLQQAIGMLSQWSFSLGILEIPWLVFGISALLLIVLAINIKRVRALHIITFLFVIIMMAIGQSSTDYYFNHDFYELQHNWHYFAYGFFALISWFYHRSKSSSRLRYLWQTFFIAVSISVFDEAAQIVISSRVFDICDIGKDIWGVLVGLTAILMLTRPKAEKIKLLNRNFVNMPKHIWSSVLLLFVFAYIFLNISSILTESRYIGTALLWSIMTYAVVIFLIYIMQFKISRIIVIILLAGLLITGLVTINENKENIVIQKGSGKISWRGITIPWFDIMLQTDGSLRLVDKKIYFNKKDKINRIYGLCDNILLIGSGSKGQGGKGFPALESHFVFNPITKKPLQILIYPNIKACRIYNKLNAEGKKVLLIMHNS